MFSLVNEQATWSSRSNPGARLRSEAVSERATWSPRMVKASCTAKAHGAMSD